MSINLTCPISGKRRDENVARIVAALVLLIAIAIRGLVAWPHTGLAAAVTLALAADFAIRGLWSPKFSPLALAGRAFISGFGIHPKHTDAAPKIFAARIGLLFTLTTAALILAGLGTAAQIVLIILSLCALFEAAFAYCVGCQMYSILPRNIGDLLARDFAA
jgi:hypothetical protein